MIDKLIYAQLSGCAYPRADKNQTPIPEGWDEIHKPVNDFITGFSVGVYKSKNGDEIVIAFTGTDEERYVDHVFGNIAIIGLPAAQVFQGAKFAMQIMEENHGAKIRFTGHSLGGGLASVMAVLFDLPATTFNSAPFQNEVLSRTILLALQGYLLDSGYANAAFIRYLIDTLADPSNQLYHQRKYNVISYYLEGEVLEYFRMVFPVIAGLEIPESIGNQTARSDDLHAMALLHSVMLSGAFKKGLTEQFRAVEIFSDKSLYARNPQYSNDPDFKNLVLNTQLTPSGETNPAKTSVGWNMLDTLGVDLQRIGTSGTVWAEQVNKGVLAVLSEYYRYLPQPDQQGFIKSIDSGIVLDLTRIDSSSDKKGQAKLLEQTENWLRTQGVYLKLPEKIDRVTLQSGDGAMQVDQRGDNKVDLIIGGEKGDLIYGGGGNDILVGFGGNDSLLGGDGADTLIGGRGADRLQGGEGYDRYFADTMDTIYDSDGNGNVTLGGSLLREATRYKSRPSYKDEDGNTIKVYKGHGYFFHYYEDKGSCGPEGCSTENNILIINMTPYSNKNGLVIEGYDHDRKDPYYLDIRLIDKNEPEKKKKGGGDKRESRNSREPSLSARS